MNDAPDASWSFVVTPVDAGRSRLVFRGRGSGGLPLLPGAFTVAIFEPVHFAMERRMMTGIKQLAEGEKRSTLWETLQVILWTTVFAAFVAASLGVFRAQSLAGAALGVPGLRASLSAADSGSQPHPILGVVLVLAAAAASSWLTERTAIT
ncbi:MAG TPA: hypothetical protein VMT47_00995 [Polyangia bacterium]|nr:hypothetical protein [Polyangia bacterium]